MRYAYCQSGRVLQDLGTLHRSALPLLQFNAYVSVGEFIYIVIQDENWLIELFW